MHSSKRTSRAQQIAAIAVAAVLLSGCAQTKGFFSGMSGSETPSGDAGILGAPGIDYYLEEMRQLASGDPAAQAEIFADAESGAQLTPGPQTNLRFALVLGTPGHPESDAARAASMLREVLAAPALLTQSEVALASIALRSAEELAAVEAEVQRLRAAVSRASSERETATSQRLASLEAENRSLSQQLRDAEEKLEAITTIERSIREQE
ncbi:MAG: hypothetical protein QNJ23_08875 [Woeseiaceae bacterium]|nr:hypothetical protein [Woeseiaceae bacterium]